MQEQLKNLINKIKSTQGLNAYDEATTKQIIIIRILNLLGWDIFDVNEIKPEYPVDPQNSNEKVDYALAKDTNNMVFVEAKAVSIDLDNYEEQLCNYCFKNNVVLGVLTNGISWWFYLPRVKGSWYERKFYSIDLIRQDADAIISKFIDFLSKQNVTIGKAEENAKKTYESKQKKQMINKSLPQAWNTLISSEDEPFMDLFNDMLEKISGFRAEPEEIAEFFAKNRTKLLVLKEESLQTTRRTKKSEHTIQPKEEKTSNYVRTGFTGKNINAFIFNNKKYKVNSWQQLLSDICEEMGNLHKNDFNKVLSLRGIKRPYFTKTPNDLRVPKKIKGTDIFVETHWSANGIVKLCKDVLSLFGYKDDLKIEYH